MDFKDLMCFTVTAEEKNLSRAADKLFVSQPALSQTLSRLEKRVGHPLFYRQQRGISLTEEGTVFLEVAWKIMRLKKELDYEMHRITHGEAGRLHLGISYFFSDFLLPRALPEFRRRYPNVEIIVHTQTSAILEKKLVKGDLDVAILADAVPNPHLQSQVLFYEQLLLAVCPESLLVLKARHIPGEDFAYLDPVHLHGERFILSQEQMRLRQSAERFFEEEGLSYRVTVVTANVETANHLALYNEGIAFIPATFAASVKERNKPLYFSTAPSLKDWTVSISRRKNGKHNPLLPQFIEIFKESL